MNTIGGFANWVQDAEYTTCPHCGKTHEVSGSDPVDTVFDCAEGTLYVEFCSGLPDRIHAAPADLRGDLAMSLPKRDGVHDRYYLIHKPDTSPEVLAEADLCIQDVLNGNRP